MSFPNLLVLLTVVQLCILVTCKKHIISTQQRYSLSENKRTRLPMMNPIHEDTVEVSEVYRGNSQHFQCSSWGIFLDVNNTQCSTYFFCYLQWENLTFTKRVFRCPPASSSNLTLLICDNDYKCPDQATYLDTIVDNSTINNEIEGDNKTYMEQNYFKYTSSGKYSNLNNNNYSRTHFCCKKRNNNWRKRKHRCSKHTYYNPSMQICTETSIIIQYPFAISLHTDIFKTSEESDSSLSTSEKSSSKESNYNFSSDDSISAISSPEFISIEYRGSVKTTYFNFSLQLCDASFKYLYYINPLKNISTIDLTTHAFAAKTSSSICLYQEDPDYFICKEKGWYPNLYDVTCTSYFRCNLLRNGSFIMAKYSCLETSLFNPQRQLCDIDYDCPCSSDRIDITTAAETIATEVSYTGTSKITSNTDSPSRELLLSSSAASAATTSSDVCAYQEDPDYFVCTEKGRYPNLNDITCTSYFLCDLVRNGSFIKTKYSCPKTSFFNPQQQLCDIDYDCPCSSDRIGILTAAETITNKNIEVSNTGTYKLTNHTNSDWSTHILSSAAASAATTSSDICAYQENPDYFVCTEKGRYPNLNDITCTSYFLCNLVRNGSFIKTKYSCPKTSFFNPQQQLCDIDYDCPCSSDRIDITTAAETITNKNIEVSNTGTYKLTSHTNSDWSKHILSSAAASAATTSSDICAYQENPDYFVCTEKGRYPNLNDITCTSYFLCNLVRNGSFIKTKYSCSKTSFFNPQQQLCDIDYDCPCSSDRIDITTAAETIATENKYVSYTDTSKITSYTDSPSTELLLSSSAASTATTLSDVCAYQEDSDYFVCTEKGRYPNLNDITCTSYFLCNLMRNGSFIKTKYSCPKTSFFNPQQQLCDIDYDCPCSSDRIDTTTEDTITTKNREISDTGTSMLTSNTVSSSTELLLSSSAASVATTLSDVCAYQEDSDYFVCTEKGRYPNLNDITCTSYFLCNLMRNGSFIKTKYSCPKTSFFNPQQQLCDIDYDCPCSSDRIDTTTEDTITTKNREISDTGTSMLTSNTVSSSTELLLSSSATSAATTSSDICAYQEDPDIFVCTDKGRYPNLNDITCTSYFLCNLVRNGSFIKTKYSCPKTSFFNPQQQLCDIDYDCPCSSDRIDISTAAKTITNKNIEVSNTGTYKLTSHTNSDWSTHILSSAAASAATTSSDICAYQENPDYFVCTEKGRYANLNDITCASYFLCNLVRNGSFIKTKYSCPKTSFFNPQQQLCDIGYDCPCSSDRIDISTAAETITNKNIEVSNTGTYKLTSHTNSDWSTHILSSAAASAATTSSDICVYQENPNYFVCTEKGRYPNLNDITCTSYFLCNLVRNGSFIKTKYSCPKTSFFNPQQQLCDIDYDCPCSSDRIDITTAAETIATENKDVSYTDTSKITSYTDSPSTELLLSSSAASAATTLSDVCAYQEDSDYFVCTEKGRYPNLNDITCTSYFLCNLVRNGSFIKTKYSCPKTSFFNPQQQLCDIDYDCPCSSDRIDTTTEDTITTKNREISDTGTSMLTSNTVSSSTELLLSSSATSAATTSSDICAYQEDPDYFVCTDKGRYPNLNDITCTSYFLCNLVRNGSFIKTKYSCPKTSFFNPQQQLCDIDYDCPCTSDRIDISTAAKIITNKNIEVSNTGTYKLTSHINSDWLTHILSSAAASAATTSSDICAYREDPDYFVCTEKGRYPNLNDITCISYFLCNLVRNGSFIKTKYSCPKTSFFNPEQQLCDIDYDCPCSSDRINIITAAETIATENKEVSYTDTSKITSNTDSPSTELLLSSSAASAATTSSDVCAYQEDPDYFVCTEKGRYPNLNDITCTSYFLCNLVRNGSFIRMKYSCPETSFFNPQQQLCDIDYDCPCSSDRIDTTTGDTITTKNREISDTCTSMLSSNTVSSSTEFLLSSSAASAATTSSDICTYQEDPDYFVCTDKGRYPNLNDVTCTSYFLCNLIRNGSFIKAQYKCPKTSFFNPQQQLCDIDYDCPCSIDRIDTTITAETIATEDKEVSNTDTSKITSNNDSPSTELLLSSSAASAATTSLDICPYQEDPDYFVCTEKGRYPNLNDLTCTSYYLCNLLRNGSFIKTKYSCPKTSVFNPPRKLCDIDYKCPCSTGSNTTIEEQVSRTNLFTTPSNSEATGNSEDCVYQKYPDYLVCTQMGRYPNFNDPTCTSYFLCNLLRNGSYIKTRYSCPKTSVFNPSRQLCDINYKCPCSSTQFLSTTVTTEDIEIEIYLN